MDWLLGELAAQPAPIDLVGHDWDALLVVRSVSLRPRLARSWAAGGAPLDSEYEWHQAARLWQTPGVGERVMDGLTPTALQKALAAGVPVADAEEAAGHADAIMKQCILSLYRSAMRVGNGVLTVTDRASDCRWPARAAQVTPGSSSVNVPAPASSSTRQPIGSVVWSSTWPIMRPAAAGRQPRPFDGARNRARQPPCDVYARKRVTCSSRRRTPGRRPWLHT